MDGAQIATLVAGHGIEGNANQGGQRQVTVIEQEVFTGLRQSLSPDVEPVMRRANLMVSGLPLEGSRHHILCVGTCRIELRGETRPCEEMDEAFPGLRRALEAHERGGAFGRVILGGRVAVGDPAWLEEADRGAEVSR
jgi:MOSC domain-containing protein YiiM